MLVEDFFKGCGMGYLGIPIIVLTAIAILLVLLGIKIASKITGTVLNLSISLCLLFLSSIAGFMFPSHTHSEIFLTINVASTIITLLLLGISGTLFKKFIWK